MSDEKNISFHDNSTFTKAPLYPVLEDNCIHVWRILPSVSNDILTKFHDSLSLDELDRLSKFHFDHLKENYITARGGLREILAKYCRIEAKELVFSYSEYGKPFLKDSDLFFNLSHSDNCILYAITKSAPVGVDVEEMKQDKNRDYLSIAKQFFSAAEYAHLSVLPEGERIEAFYRCWARKEAFIKTLGLGLSYPIEKLNIGFLSLADGLLKIQENDNTAWGIREFLMTATNAKKKWIGVVTSLQPFEKICYWDF